jgi:hypothetical protein
MSFNHLRLPMALALAVIAGLAAAVAIVAGPAYAAGIYNLQGSWTTGTAILSGSVTGANGTYTITSMNTSTGSFSGTAIVEGITFTLSGTETGATAVYTLSEGGYVATDTLHLGVLGDGKIGGSGTFSDTNGVSNAPFAAELGTPGGTGTTTGTTSTTTTTGSSLTPTATAVECDYFSDTQEDVCNAFVGDATGSGSTPTGTVTFSGDRGGSCQLTQVPQSPGIASCSITVTGSQNFLNVTASYGGDQTQSPSSAATQLLNAGQGNGLDNPTIPTFNNSSFTTTFNNLIAGATVTTSADLTDGTGASCSAAGSSQAPNLRLRVGSADLVRADKHKAAKVVSLKVRTTVRHARRGKLRLKVTFNAKKLARFVKQTKSAMLIVDVTAQPKHGRTIKESVAVPVTLKVTNHGVRISTVASASTAKLIAHDAPAPAPKCYPQVEETFSGQYAAAKNADGTVQTGYNLTLTFFIPSGTDNVARQAARQATLTGTVTAKCVINGSAISSVTANVNLTDIGDSGPFTYSIGPGADNGTAVATVTGVSVPAPSTPPGWVCPSLVTANPTLPEIGPWKLTQPPAANS